MYNMYTNIIQIYTNLSRFLNFITNILCKILIKISLIFHITLNRGTRDVECRYHYNQYYIYE